MATLSSQSEQIAVSVLKLLNAHGYSFQHTVIRLLENLFSEGKSRWLIDGVEFPVTAGGQTTHIDFILKSKTGRTYMVVECKRADPAKAKWCFTRAPYTMRNPRPTEVIFEQFSLNALGLVTRRAMPAYANEGPYHLGLELRTGEIGDGKGQRNQAINEAITQVLRGTSGLINHLEETASRRPETTLIRFVPVIVTTAEICVSNIDIGGADLRTGNLPHQEVQIDSPNSIWFTHNRSPALKPNAPSATATSDFNNFSAALRNEFARSVAIINTDGIEEFMSWDLEEWLW